MTDASSATTAFRAARDQLLELRGQHERAVSEFEFPAVGPRFNWAVDWFDAIARGNDRAALTIIDQGGSPDEKVTTISFDLMSRRSDQVAAWLAGLGVRRGDAVLLMLGNQVELWDTMLGVMKLGAVLMPTTTAAGPGDLVDRLHRGGARAVIADSRETHKFDDVPGDYLRIAVPTGADAGLGVGAGDDQHNDAQPRWLDLHDAYGLTVGPAPHPETAPDDRLLLYFTSGTTSRPKLVEHTQQSYPCGHLTTMYWIGLQPGDVHLNISSPGWAKHAWSCFFAPWIAESTIFIYNFTRFDPAALLRVLTEHQVTSLCAPPTVWRMLINADLSGGPGTLREIVAAGEPLNPEVIARVHQAWGLHVRDGYGQTETTAIVGNTVGSPLKPGSMGRPLPGCPVVLVDPITNERVALADAQGDAGGEHGSETVIEGEICLDLTASPTLLMTGYQGDEQRNADAMAGGFYHTGDVASVDADGYITYVGRTDDVFKASDYKISPFEVESVLIEHPAVAEAAVVPSPDPVRLAIPKAYIALAPGHLPDAEVAHSILAHARARLAPWQRVRRIEFYDLPKTISGKIRRVELRGREVDLDGSGAAQPELEWRIEQFPDLSS
ncbi:AMP-dependent synthetase [Humibacillus sp. DSM 29435]|uniref:AMP-binding protein n=1 Tax=Humibacillus sp. DSM 29435 TaxID=1869167 RepID=UPI0008732B8A|nr:AMP-binding protein [Humibacillus sp. DSM 29435]OFE15357.1 AMP-dependent synthetase [Humibacillus sp. DSM 29435]